MNRSVNRSRTQSVENSKNNSAPNQTAAGGPSLFEMQEEIQLSLESVTSRIDHIVK